MPALHGVLETALYVDVLGLKPVFADQRLCAFAVAPKSVLLLFPRGKTLETVVMPGGTIPPHAAHAVVIEGRTDWPRGGTSIYFHDPDGHLLELATPGLWPGY